VYINTCAKPSLVKFVCIIVISNMKCKSAILPFAVKILGAKPKKGRAGEITRPYTLGITPSSG
jgi:hypothetical protein